ncbi:MAG: hypothetical protein ACREDL_22635 [Bradyrhizobium sp.]
MIRLKTSYPEAVILGFPVLLVLRARCPELLQRLNQGLIVLNFFDALRLGAKRPKTGSKSAGSCGHGCSPSRHHIKQKAYTVVAMDALNQKYGTATLFPASMLLARAAAPSHDSR